MNKTFRYRLQQLQTQMQLSLKSGLIEVFAISHHTATLSPHTDLQTDVSTAFWGQARQTTNLCK